MAYNTNQQNSTKLTLYFLIYGRTVRLSIKGEILNKSTLLDRVITLVHKLSLFKESARITIKRTQEKIKQDYSV